MTTKDIPIGIKIGLIVAIIVLAIIASTALSCEKLDETYCWDCVIFFYEEDYGEHEASFEMSDPIEKCDYSELDAQKFEKSKTRAPLPISTCGDMVRWQDCICEKQQP